MNKGDNSLWTETPAERQQRIADEVAGKKRRAVDVANEEALGVGSSSKKRSKREEESIKKGVDEYTVRLSLFFCGESNAFFRSLAEHTWPFTRGATFHARKTRRRR